MVSAVKFALAYATIVSLGLMIISILLDWYHPLFAPAAWVILFTAALIGLGLSHARSKDKEDK